MGNRVGTSTGDIYYVCKYTVKDGQLENLKALEHDMTADTKKFEPGTLSYEWNISEDGKECHVLQLYKDSDALTKHITGVFAKYKERVGEVLVCQSVEIYGAASEKVKHEAAEAFADMAKTTYFTRLGGYNRAGRTQKEVQRIL